MQHAVPVQIPRATPGRAEDQLWGALGWASPYALECATAEDEDVVLDMLGLEYRRLPVAAPGVAALQAILARGVVSRGLYTYTRTGLFIHLRPFSYLWFSCLRFQSLDFEQQIVF